MIPIIATRNTAELQQAMADTQTGRPLLGNTGIDPNIYANESATAEQAPWLIGVPIKGSLSADEFTSALAIESGMHENDVRMIYNAAYEVIESFVSQYGAVKIFTPFGIIETMVPGSSETPAEAIDPETSRPYLNVTPNDNYRQLIKGLAFYNATGGTAPFKVATVHQALTDAEGPFQIGSVVNIRGFNFRDGATVKFVDDATGAEAQATVSAIHGGLIVATVPSGLNPDHKFKVVVTQTFDDVEWPIRAERLVEVLPTPQPDHEILLVKHGERADNEIAFDETNPVVCTVAHHNGAGYELKAEKPVKVVLDYENQRHVYAVLDTQTIVNATETTVSFMNDENDTEEVDGSFWNHDVELTLYFADGGSATKTVRFVQL